MATTAAAAHDIPSQASRDRDNLAVVAARNASGTVTRSQALPTPPNSMSPAFGPHSLKAQLGEAKLEPVDSDLDLQDDDPSPTASDSADSITSTMLAKHYLPDILLYQGPLAIRHIMGCLTTSVPGFAAIPPTKARRLVVAALEGRGGEGSEESDGYIEFEKVGWGRWDARRRGQPGRQRRTPPPERIGSPYPRGLAIPDAAARRKADRSRPRPSASAGPDTMTFSYGGDNHGDQNLIECETDKMSLDGSCPSTSCSDTTHDDDDDDLDMNGDGDADGYDEDDPEDATDDEDWAAMGAAALRAASYPSSATTPVTDGRGIARGVGITSFTNRFTVPGSSTITSQTPVGLDRQELVDPSNAQERAAVEALLSLGTL